MGQLKFGRLGKPVIGCAWAALLLCCSPLGWARQSRPVTRAGQPKPGPTSQAEIGWYKFRGPDGDFTIDFPSKPDRRQDLPGPITVVRQFALATDSIFLAVSISDFGGSPDDPSSNDWGPAFEQNYAKLIREDGTRLVQLRRLAKDTYEAEGWAPASKAGAYQHFLSRNILRNGRNYRIGCNSLVRDQEVDKRVCRRFFNSFRIVGSPQ